MHSLPAPTRPIHARVAGPSIPATRQRDGTDEPAAPGAPLRIAASPASARGAELIAHALAARLGADLVEGPAAWVVLTAELAWRIAKPSQRDRLPPELRRHACEQAVQVGTVLAPGVVLGVECIHGSVQQPRMGDAEVAIAYAVRMLRLPDSGRLRDRLAAGEDVRADMDALGALLARFHSQAAPAPGGRLQLPWSERFESPEAFAMPSGICTRSQDRVLQAWLREEAARLEPAWAARHAQGRVRACHGNLHLGNLVRHAGGVAALDPLTGLERYRDVVDDVALPMADLWALGATGAAWRLFNRWLEGTGDVAAVPLLRHAMVEQALRLSRAAWLHGTARRSRARQSVQVALDWIQQAPPQLTITHGGTVDARTAAAQALAERQWAPCLPVPRDGDAPDHERLLGHARACLEHGFPVVLQGPWARRHERDRAHELARQLHAQFCIVDVDGAGPARPAPAGDDLQGDERSYVQRLQA